MIDLNTIEIPVTGTVSFWKAIGKALEELPFKDAYPLITTIDRQLHAYIAGLQPKPAEAQDEKAISADPPSAQG